MDLIFFDLDGTLLNKGSQLSPYTRDTLNRLKDNNIAHTVATGRTMQSAKRLIDNHFFDFPNIYSNGVTVWNPRDNALTLRNLLNNDEINFIVESAISEGLAPFVHTVKTDSKHHEHIVFHGQPNHKVEEELLQSFGTRNDVLLRASLSVPTALNVTNISMIGATDMVHKVYQKIEQVDNLVAYSGETTEAKQCSWIDVHHKLANKGSAVNTLKTQFGASNIICFGDSYNDLSMFELADECYAPKNAIDEIKKVASAVIGHHDDDGVAQFLRERFSL